MWRWIGRLKINPLRMKAGIILQAVIVLLIIALAASCTIGKEYSTRVFKKRAIENDSTQQQISFLEMDSLDTREMIVISVPDKEEVDTAAASIPKPGGVVRTKRSRE